jgi:prepilin-type N-terminal cleavage/methylation domain-containing protein
MRKGFTLVELSIVLVIVGLLIGGILVAQSMIETSKISAQVAQIQQFDAGVMNFKMKYNYLPSDAPAFGGDGDGIIDQTDVGGGGDAVVVFLCELASFWHSIDPVQFPGTAACAQPGAQAVTSGANKNVPAAKVGKGGSYLIASVRTDAAFATPERNNFYVVLDRSQAQAPIISNWYYFLTTSALNSPVRPVELPGLDKKMDDSIADTGNVVSGSIGNWAGTGVGGPMTIPITGLCSSGPVYNLTSNNYECTPLIRIGAQAGAPQ